MPKPLRFIFFNDDDKEDGNDGGDGDGGLPDIMMSDLQEAAAMVIKLLKVNIGSGIGLLHGLLGSGSGHVKENAQWVMRRAFKNYLIPWRTTKFPGEEPSGTKYPKASVIKRALMTKIRYPLG